MKPHFGKIAQLPREIRDELNERLERSEPGPEILDWVNALPEVKELIDACFDGVPVSKQNLSDWRRSGHQEWRLRADLLACAADVPQLAGELPQGADGNGLFHGVAQILAARIAAILYRCDGELTAQMKDEANLYKSLSLAVVRLQRTGLRVVKEEWERERERERWEREMEKEAQGKLLGTMMGALQHGELSKTFGGGTAGSKIADLFGKVASGDYKNLPVLEPTDTFAQPRQRTKKAVPDPETPEKSPPVKESKGSFTPDSTTDAESEVNRHTKDAVGPPDSVEPADE